MNIAMINGVHPDDQMGGAELQVHLLAKALQMEGHNVFYYAVLSDRGKVRQRDNEYEIERLFEKRVLKRITLAYKELRKRKIDVVYVRCLYSFWWVKIICELLKIPTLFHISSITSCYYVPGVWKNRNNIINHLKKIFMNIFYVFSIKFADVLICQTVEQKKLLDKNLHRQAVVVRNGYGLSQKPPSKDLSSTFNVIWIGKYWKEPDLFIQLARRFSQNENVKFLMVGIFPGITGEPYKLIEKELNNFTFLGEKSIADIDALLATSHILVNTSEHEGFSNTFLQAWLHGVPVISLNVDPDNLLKTNHIGSHSGTMEQMENDLKMFIDDKNKYLQYSDLSYRYFCEEHDIKKSALKLIKLMENLTKNGRRQNNKNIMQAS